MFTDYCPSCRLPGNPLRLCPSCSRQALSERFDTFMTRCPSCYHPLVSEIYVCPNCTMKIYAEYDYSASFARHLVLRWKMNGERRLSTLISNMFSDILIELNLTPENCVLAKVPSSRNGRRKRGWDHMSDVLSSLCRKKGYKSCDILVRTKDNSVQQKTLNREERFEAALSAFSIKKGYKNPSLPVVILDDITTTGASLHACKSVLEKEGIEVWGAVTLLQEL